MNVDFLAGFVVGYLLHCCYCDFLQIMKLRREIAALEAKWKDHS